MRFLANENFPLDAVETLRQQGHDVVWIRTAAPGIADPEVLNRAQIEDRILLTFDKDFSDETPIARSVGQSPFELFPNWSRFW